MARVHKDIDSIKNGKDIDPMTLAFLPPEQRADLSALLQSQDNSEAIKYLTEYADALKSEYGIMETTKKAVGPKRAIYKDGKLIYQ